MPHSIAANVSVKTMRPRLLRLDRLAERMTISETLTNSLGCSEIEPCLIQIQFFAPPFQLPSAIGAARNAAESSISGSTHFSGRRTSRTNSMPATIATSPQAM